MSTQTARKPAEQMTIAELQAEIGRLQVVLHHKVCGDTSGMTLAEFREQGRVATQALLSDGDIFGVGCIAEYIVYNIGMKDTDAAWLAGILDGEGSLMIVRNDYSKRKLMSFYAAVAVSNTNRTLIERCRDIAGGGAIVETKPSNARFRRAYIWTMKSRLIDRVLPLVQPYLVIKGEQARLIAELRAGTRRGSPPGRFGTKFTEAEYEHKRALYLRMKELNARGCPQTEDSPVKVAS